MKAVKKEVKSFEYNVIISELEEHPLMDKNTKGGIVVEERIELAYNKSSDLFFISNYYSSPNDSYGCDWYISDSGCHMSDQKN